MANFAKFKGNDKQDALRFTNGIATDVKKAFMQLQHEFPDVHIQFEPMPNPMAFGKKREGFISYQQALNDWKDIAMRQIENAREATMRAEFTQTRKTVVKSAIAVADVVDNRADALAEQIDEKASDLNSSIKNENAKTRQTVINEGRKTRATVHAEGAKTRKAVHDEGTRTRNAVYDSESRVHHHINAAADQVHDHIDVVRKDIRYEAYKNRTNTNERAQETQEINSLDGNIQSNISKPNKARVKDKVNEIKEKIISSDISFEDKKELLKNLDEVTSAQVVKDKDLDKINEAFENKPSRSYEEKPIVDRLKYPSQEYQIPYEQYPEDKPIKKKSEQKESGTTNEPQKGPEVVNTNPPKKKKSNEDPKPPNPLTNPKDRQGHLPKFPWQV